MLIHGVYGPCNAEAMIHDLERRYIALREESKRLFRLQVAADRKNGKLKKMDAAARRRQRSGSKSSAGSMGFGGPDDAPPPPSS